MKNFKKNLAVNITLICVLSFSLIHLLILTLSLFNVLNLSLPNNFSYIGAYILMVISFALYIVGFWIETIKSLKIPTWIKVAFYIALFIFTNVYYILGLYQMFAFLLVFIAFMAAFLNIIALSTFFNLTKDEKNKVKTTTKLLTFNVSTYSVALCSLALFIISIIKVIFGAHFIVSALLTFVIEISTMLVVCAIFNTIFALSHKKTKKLLNACLIKIIHPTITPSVKSAK